MSKGELTVEQTAGTVDSKGLKGGALGLVSSIVVGMASTAPAYSLAASLGLIVASGGALLAGVKAPAIILMAFIPMWMIAVAYQELTKPNRTAVPLSPGPPAPSARLSAGWAAGESSPPTSS